MNCLTVSVAELESVIGTLALLCFFGPLAALALFFWFLDPVFEAVRAWLVGVRKS